MAKFIEIIKPIEASYRIEITQTELDILAGLLNDLTDNRGVTVRYSQEYSEVIPTPNCHLALRNIRNILFEASPGDYTYGEYFDYWEEVDKSGDA
jgi:hypothetical protein